VHQQFFDHLKAHCEDLTGNDVRLLSLNNGESLTAFVHSL